LRQNILPALRSVIHCTSLFVVLLYGEVPKCHLIVCSGRGEDRILCRVPFDGCDGCAVPCERGDGRGIRCGGPRQGER